MLTPIEAKNPPYSLPCCSPLTLFVRFQLGEVGCFRLAKTRQSNQSCAVISGYNFVYVSLKTSRKCIVYVLLLISILVYLPFRVFDQFGRHVYLICM